MRIAEGTSEIGTMLCPVPIPPAVMCIGLNYKQHALETGQKEPLNPIVFYKNPSAVTGPYDDIVIPFICKPDQEVDYECELAVVIGPRPVRNVLKEDALDYVLGYTSANDVSARRWQGKKGGGQWSYSKSFDTFCPLGPGLLYAGPKVDPNQLSLETRLNGQVVQRSTTADMIFDVGTLISFLSQSTTLLPGTIILTGTPAGVGFARKPPLFLKDGDVVEVELEGVGVQRNKVVVEDPAVHDAPRKVWSHSKQAWIHP